MKRHLDARQIAIWLLALSGWQCGGSSVSPAPIPSVEVVNYAGTYPASPDFWGSVFKTDCVELTTLRSCFSNVADTEIFHLELVQTKDLVSARVKTDAVDGPLSGEIDNFGKLVLRGTLPSLNSHGSSFPFQKIVSWSTFLDKSGAMYGTFTSRFLARDGTELFQVTQEMRGISHSR